MKIAYSRLTQTIDLHPNNTSQGFSFERFDMMRELAKRGHTFRIIIDMNNPTEKLWKEVKAGKVTKVNGLDVSWMNSIEYDPVGFPEKDDDVLFIEHGAVNMMFDSKHADFLQLLRSREQIKAHKGLVILYNADPDLPFPIHKFAGAQKDWTHPKNPYRLETKDNTFGDGKYNFKNYNNLEQFGWGDWEDLFSKDKTIVILTKSTNLQTLIDNQYGGARGKHHLYHKKGYVHLEGLPSVYTTKFMKKFDFNENPEYDIFYAGYPRNREPSFIQLFHDMPKKLKLVTTGPWSPKKQQNMLPNYNHTCLGTLKGLREIPKVANNSRAILQLGVKKSKVFDFVTSRHLEAVFSKTICLYDASYTAMQPFLGKEFALHNHDDAIKKYLAVSKLSNEQRYNIWRFQYQLCQNYNFKWYVTELEKLCKRYGVKVKPKKYKSRGVKITKDMKKAVKGFVKIADKVNTAKPKISKRRKQDE